MARGLPIDNLTSEKRDYQDSGKLASTGREFLTKPSIIVTLEHNIIQHNVIRKNGV